MIETTREALIDPDGFFEDRTDPRLLPAAAVVTSYTVLQIVAEYLLVFVLFRGYSPGVLLLGLLGFVVSQSIYWFGSWLIFTTVFHALSYVFGGEGSFRRTLTLVGWGFLPVIAGGLLMIIAKAIAAQGAPSMTIQSAEQIAAAVERFEGGLATQAANLVSGALYIWCCYIWVFALKHARGLSTRQALVTVGVPVVFFSSVSLLV